MSQYLPFLFDYHDVPTPGVVLLPAGLEPWIERQLTDEFLAAFDSLRVVVSDNPANEPWDVFVLPYQRDFRVEQPLGRDVYHRLRAFADRHVVLYGLVGRRIRIHRAADVWRLHRRMERVHFWMRVLDKLRMDRVAARALAALTSVR